MSLELAHIAYGKEHTGDAHGPPVLIMHGLLGSARNWGTFGRHLGGTRRVFALDLRNHGASPWADQMTYGQMADDVRAFLALHGLPSAAVIGHSMGGKVAMRLALDHGNAVDCLVVVDIAPAAYRRDFHAYVEAMRRLDLSQLKRRSDADLRLADDIAEAGVRAFLLQNLVNQENGLGWRLPLDTIADNMQDIMDFSASVEAEIYQGPTLFVTGSRSSYVRSEHHETILRLFPRARFAEIEGAGHWVQAEAPKAFATIVGGFLAAPNSGAV